MNPIQKFVFAIGATALMSSSYLAFADAGDDENPHHITEQFHYSYIVGPYLTYNTGTSYTPILEEGHTWYDIHYIEGEPGQITYRESVMYEPPRNDGTGG